MHDYRVLVENCGVTDDEILEGLRAQMSATNALPPAPLEAIEELEAEVGYAMPPLLRRIYLELADGGFGRGGEALSLTDQTCRFSEAPPLLEAYLEGWRDVPEEEGRPEHPRPVVPLLTWGCAIWSLVDYSTTEGRMWGWDPNVYCPKHRLFPEQYALAERLSNWLEGREDFPRRLENPDCLDCRR